MNTAIAKNDQYYLKVNSSIALWFTGRNKPVPVRVPIRLHYAKNGIALCRFEGGVAYQLGLATPFFRTSINQITPAKYQAMWSLNLQACKRLLENS